MYTIYLCKCRRSGKGYVGQTEATLKVRWRKHVNRAIYDKPNQCPALSAAIRKYGAESFERSILQTVQTRRQANRAESEWIAKLNTLAPNGYNLDRGGGVRGVSAETSAKLSAATKRQMAKLTAKERSARAREIMMRKSPEERRALGLAGWANLTQKQREARCDGISQAAGLGSRLKELARIVPAQAGVWVMGARAGSPLYYVHWREAGRTKRRHIGNRRALAALNALRLKCGKPELRHRLRAERGGWRL